MFTRDGDDAPFEFQVQKPTKGKDIDGRPVEIDPSTILLGEVTSTDPEAIAIELVTVGEDGQNTYRGVPGSANEDGTPRGTILSVPIFNKADDTVLAQATAEFRVKTGPLVSFEGPVFSFPFSEDPA